MGVVVDTSIVVEFERRGAAPEALASFFPSETIFLSAITVGESFYGLERTANPARRTQRSAYLEGLIESIDVLQVDLADARVYAVVRSALAQQGRPSDPRTCGSPPRPSRAATPWPPQTSASAPACPACA